MCKKKKTDLNKKNFPQLKIKSYWNKMNYI